MKIKNIIANSTASLIFMSALLISSCDKEAETVKPTETNQISAEDLAIAKQVKSFKNLMNSTQKTGTIYEVTEMEWLVETTINYYYSITKDSNEVVGDSIVIPFNNKNGYVTGDELCVIYNQVLTNLGQQSREISGTNVNLSYVDISINENDGITNLLAIGSFNYTQTNKIAVFPSINTSIIGETDFWWSSNDQGKCGIYDNQSVGRDAGDIIADEVNPKVKNTLNFNQYWADVNIKIFLYYDYPIEKESINNYEYRIFYFYRFCCSSLGFPCLSPDEIQYFSDQLEIIINDYETSIKKECIKINSVWCNGASAPVTKKYHVPVVSFGNARARISEEAGDVVYSLP